MSTGFSFTVTNKVGGFEVKIRSIVAMTIHAKDDSDLLTRDVDPSELDGLSKFNLTANCWNAAQVEKLFHLASGVFDAYCREL
jgi:hypothetical protein